MNPQRKRRIYFISLATAGYFLLLGLFLYLIAPSFAFNVLDEPVQTVHQNEIVSFKGDAVLERVAGPINSLAGQTVSDVSGMGETAVPDTQAEASNVALAEQAATSEPSVRIERGEEGETAVGSFESNTQPLRPVPTNNPNPQTVFSPDPTITQYGQLIIPSIDVNHVITNVPVINGNWDISQLDSQVGHLQTTGEHPGDNLAMTFIGHVTLPWPGTGPFADLILLEHGEEIIYRWNGFDYIYEVSRIFRVQPEDVHILYHDDPNGLQLATCSGWNLLNREYGQRLVTRATLVRVEPTPLN